METTARPFSTFGGALTQAPAWKVWLAGLVIVLAGWLAYSNSLLGAFVMDDRGAILDNQSIQHGWREAWSPPNDGSPVTGRPLVNLTFALSYRLSGLSPWGYHGVSLAIHLLAALSLFGLVRRTLALPKLAAHYGGSAMLLALSVALLWMLHPLQTEAVTYLSQRSESLMGLFYLLTIYGLARSGQSQRPWFWQVLSVAACLLGMLSKEVMVTAPLVALLYDRTFMAGSFANAWRQRWKLYVALGCTWIPLALLIDAAGNRGQSVGFGLGINGWEYAWVELRVVVHYLQLSVWPHPLVLNYGDHLPQLDYLIIFDALVVAVLTAGALWALWRKPALGFVGASFFVILAPSSSIIPVVTEPVAEHRLYLPLAGLVVLAVFGLWEFRRNWTWALTLAWVVVLGALTFLRNGDFQTAITLWQDNTAKLPALAVLHKNLAVAYANAGRLGEGIQEDETSLRLNPQDATTENNLGLHWLNLGRFDQALEHFQRAVALDPDYVQARSEGGIILLKTGHVPEAVAEFQRVLQIAPDSPEGQINLGNAYNYAGQPAAALRYYQSAARLEPDLADVHYGLGNTLSLLGRLDEAMGEYEYSLRLRPKFPEAHYALGLDFSKAGRLAEAIAQYQIALTELPGFPAAQRALLSAQQRLQRQANPSAP